MGPHRPLQFWIYFFLSIRSLNVSRVCTSKFSPTVSASFSKCTHSHVKFCLNGIVLCTYCVSQTVSRVSLQQSPVRQSLLGSLRRDGHWKCLGLTLLITCCLTAIVWCRLSLATEVSHSLYEAYNIL